MYSLQPRTRKRLLQYAVDIYPHRSSLNFTSFIIFSYINCCADPTTTSSATINCYCYKLLLLQTTATRHYREHYLILVHVAPPTNQVVGSGIFLGAQPNKHLAVREYSWGPNQSSGGFGNILRDTHGSIIPRRVLAIKGRRQRPFDP
jgi:hypothetical protein